MNILFFPWRDWNSYKREGFRTREANILKTLGGNSNVNNILCVNRSSQPFYINALLRKNKNYIFKGGTKSNNLNQTVVYKRLFSKLTKVEDTLFVLDLYYYLPNPKGNKLERYTFFSRILEKEVKYAIKTLGYNDDYITWAYDVTRSSLVKNFKKKLLIYDIIDNLIEHDQLKKEQEFYKEKYINIKDNSDIIFTVSKNLKEELFSDHRKTFQIPNGIDLNKYNNELNKVVNKNKRSKVGYIGLMQERIDIELLKKVISLNKEVDFCFVGPVLTPLYFQEIQGFSNVEFLGAVHHDLIPQYINGFDVCIIPHKVNRFTNSMNPLKLYEYLACGKQVITTAVPPSDLFKEVVYIANSYEEFDFYLKKAVYEPFSKFSKQMIQEQIIKHDWNNRVAEMLSTIEIEMTGGLKNE